MRKLAARHRASGTPRTPVHGSAWWRGFPAWTRLSFVGLVAAGLLALGLGIFIPEQVENHLLNEELEFDRMTLAGALANADIYPGKTPVDLDALDRFVREQVLIGDYVRVKLWAPDGTVLYSDEPRAIGFSHPPKGELAEAIQGVSLIEVTRLDDSENRFEQGLAERLLESYLPVKQDGKVVAVWEVYRSLDRLDAALARVRHLVWLSVGVGLGTLAVFLAATVGPLVTVAERRRREAEKRSRELGSLLEVSRSVSASLDADQLAVDAVRTIREVNGLRAAALVRRAKGTDPEIVAASAIPGCPIRCVLEAGPGAASVHPGCETLGVSLGRNGGGLMLVACRNRGDQFSPEDHDLLAAAGEQIRIAVEKADLYANLKASERTQRDLTGRLVTAHEEERKRIVGEIHDGLGQDLHRVLFGLRGCRAGSTEEVIEETHRLEELVEQSVRGLRVLLRRLRPPSLEGIGLASGLRGLVDQAWSESGLTVDLRLGAFPEPPVPVRVAVFRIVQEALHNVAKHARADAAEVELKTDGETLVVRVSDPGQGLPSEADGGLGLWLMRERAEALGGDLSLESDRSGTTVLVHIPTGVAS